MDVLLDESNRQAYLSGFTWILLLTLVSAVFSLVLGVILAAMRVSPIPVLRWAGSMWVQLFRNTPLTLIIFFCYFGLFSTLGFKVSNNITVNNFWLGVVGLSVYTAAFVCEAIRAGINSVPAGQAEAARAIGLTFSQSLTITIYVGALSVAARSSRDAPSRDPRSRFAITSPP